MPLCSLKPDCGIILHDLDIRTPHFDHSKAENRQKLIHYLIPSWKACRLTAETFLLQRFYMIL